MKDSVVANKYALALFQLAQEKNEVDRIENELHILKEIIHKNEALIVFLKSPNVGKDTKREFVKNTCKDFSQYIINLVLLLIDRHRIDYLGTIIDNFIAISYDEKGIAKAKVESVRPLKDSEIDAISTVFAKKVNKQTLEIENIVNDDLLGGIKVQIGNRIFDGSLRGKLNGLKRELIG